MRLFGRRKKNSDVLDSLVRDVLNAYETIYDAKKDGEIDRKMYYLALLKTAELTINALLNIGLNDGELRPLLEEISTQLIEELKKTSGEENAKKIYG